MKDRESMWDELVRSYTEHIETTTTADTRVLSIDPESRTMLEDIKEELDLIVELLREIKDR